MKESTTLREQSLEWFFGKNEIERCDLKQKHFSGTPIPFSNQWGYEFTFGQIEEMFNKENLNKK